jgi:hypothetical protein
MRRRIAFPTLVITILWASAVSQFSGVRGVNAMSIQRGSDEPSEPIQRVYERALSSFGYPYLEQEAELQQRSKEAIPFLRSRQTSATESFDGFAAGTLADWLEGRPRPEYIEVMKQLRKIDEQMSETPAGGIRADVVESTMTRIAGNHLVAILALRLGKGALTPSWLERGALQYVNRHGGPAILPALERYVTNSADKAGRDFALKTIARMKAR